MVDVDPGLLIGLVLATTFFGMLFFGFFIIAVRRPEFRAKMSRKKWVYAIVRNALGELKEHLIDLEIIQKSPTRSFKIGTGTYFWRPQDKKGRQTVFPYKKHLAAIFQRGIPFPEAFSEESLSALGGYTSEEFTSIIESKVEENIVAAMRPKNLPYAIMIGILLIAIIASTVYLGFSIGTIGTTHAGTGGTTSTGSTGSTGVPASAQCPTAYPLYTYLPAGAIQLHGGDSYYVPPSAHIVQLNTTSILQGPLCYSLG